MFMVLLLAVVADIIKYVVVVNDNDIMYVHNDTVFHCRPTGVCFPLRLLL